MPIDGVLRPSGADGVSRPSGADGVHTVDHLPRIAVLGREIADQIAAGEVVDRPASVVKELVENAVDAGATRVDVELENAGMDRIVVRDDGHGIHPDDLVLAITRHATSKLRTSSDLLDVVTLGFRGEALASLAAVATVVLESRMRSATAGTRLRSRPGLPPEHEPVAMAPGTRIEATRLFGNVPARRKFVRTEATEVAHCTETMLRLGVSHPHVHLSLTHNGRKVLALVASSLPDRLVQVLHRRTQARATRVEGEHGGVSVVAFLTPAEAALRSRAGLFVVVRRRVVHHVELAHIVEAAYGDALPKGRYPIACLVVDPPRGTVDVNVHPQKAEVRFADPQVVYTAVRAALGQWRTTAVAEAPAVRSVNSEVAVALDAWGRTGGGGTLPSSALERGSAYRLQTRAASEGYSVERSRLREAAEELRTRSASAAADRRVETNGHDADTPVASAELPLGTPEDSLLLMTCLPGPVGIFRSGEDLLAVDLRRLRSHLLFRRLTADLGGGRVEAQGLLEPVLVRCRSQDVDLVVRGQALLEELGIVAEAFGGETVRVRAVPAILRHCVDEPDVHDLLQRVLPWLRLRQNDPTAEAHVAIEAIAEIRGADPAPRLARRWLRELVLAGESIDELPGVRRWSSQELVP